jgi:DNA-directed RNA polymerase subunit RPC12/RpoP
VLVGMIAIQVVLILGYQLIAEFLYYPNLLWFTLTLAYAGSIRCPQCGRRQVFRGLSVFDLRLPGERCYYCGSSLSSSE